MKKLTSFLIVSALALSGAVSAQEQQPELPDPGILPGSPFAFVDSLFERVQLLFAFSAQAKAERNLTLAEERLAEAEALVEQGAEDRPEAALERYQEHLNEALAKAAEAQENGQNVDEVLQRVAEATARHQETLARVYEQVPEQAKEAIGRAMQESAQGHEGALDAISDEREADARSEVHDASTDSAQDRLQEFRRRGVPVPFIPR